MRWYTAEGIITVILSDTLASEDFALIPLSGPAFINIKIGFLFLPETSTLLALGDSLYALRYRIQYRDGLCYIPDLQTD